MVHQNNNEHPCCSLVLLHRRCTSAGLCALCADAMTLCTVHSVRCPVHCAQRLNAAVRSLHSGLGGGARELWAHSARGQVSERQVQLPWSEPMGTTNWIILVTCQYVSNALWW